LLIGSFVHTIDAKGRVFIPAKWRKETGSSFVVTWGILSSGSNRCLFAMSEAQWEEFGARFSSLSVADTQLQNFRRKLFASAGSCEADSQGRILIPANLREYAGLDKEAVLVGVDNRIEIWSQEAWDRQNEEMDNDYQEAVKRLAELGI